MRAMIENSLIYRLITAIGAWIDRQWQKSRLAAIISGSGSGSEGSVVGKAGSAVHRALCSVFRALKLDRLFEGSVFTRKYFWMGAAVLLAPILPTAAVLVLALIAIGSVVLTYAVDRERRAAASPVKKWFVAYALVYAVSAAFSMALESTLSSTLLTVIFAVFAVAMLDTHRTFRDAKRLVTLLVVGGTVVAGYGILQAVLGRETSAHWIDEELFSNISQRVYSTLDNPNILSEYLLLVIPLGVALTVNAKSANGRIAALVSTAVMVACMFLTWSRAGWVGLLLELAVLLVLMDRRFLLPGLLGAVVVVAFLPQGILDRLLSVGSMEDSSAFYRFSIWTGTLRMLRDCWIAGVGPGAFSVIYPQYSLNAAITKHAHNLYFQLMCDSGVPGILTFVGLVVSAVRAAAGTISRGADRERRVLLLALLSGVVGFLIQSVAEYSFYNYRVMLVFFIVIGLIGSLSLRETEADR